MYLDKRDKLLFYIKENGVMHRISDPVIPDAY